MAGNKSRRHSKKAFPQLAAQALTEIGITDPYDALGYEHTLWDFAMETMLHTKTAGDACKVMSSWRYLEKRQSSLEDLVDEDLLELEEHPSRHSSFLSGYASGLDLLRDENTRGVYIITNAMPEEGRIVCIFRRKELDAADITDPFAGQDEPHTEDMNPDAAFTEDAAPSVPSVPGEKVDRFTAEMASFTASLHGIAPCEGSGYCLAPDPDENSTGMNLCRDGEVLCGLEPDKNTDGLLVTPGADFPYALRNAKGGIIEVYGKEYLSSLAPETEPLADMMAAHISWCVADEKEGIGIARLEIRREDEAVTDILLLLAASCIMMYEHRHAQQELEKMHITRRMRRHYDV